MASEVGQTVVVTGASAGVGRAAAIAFGRRGCRVALLARSREGLAGAQADVEAAGGRALAIEADVADANAVEAAAERAESELGPLDVWVNSAMITSFSPFVDMAPEEFRRITEVTYLGQVYGTLAALRRMRPRDHGTVVQVGSALAYRSIPLQSAYCGAKHAIRGFTDSLRSELLHEGSQVRLTMVQLPGLNTPQFDWARNRLAHKPQPVAPVFQPEVAAEAVVHAAQSAPRELWVGKSSVMAILGSMAVPGWLDRKLAVDAYGGQESDEPADPERRDNLFQPVPEKCAVHGRFDARARSDSFEISSETVHAALFPLAAGLAALSFVAGNLLGRKTER